MSRLYSTSRDNKNKIIVISIIIGAVKVIRRSCITVIAMIGLVRPEV